MKSLLPLALLALVATPAVARQDDKDALKKKILRDVEDRLKKQDDQLLREIERMIDEQLGQKGALPAPKAEPKPVPDAAPKPEAKPEAKPEPEPAPKAAPAPKAPPALKAPAPPRKGRGFMGVRTDTLGDDEKADLKVKNGIKVVEVVKDGPADKAGLQVDDVIVGLDGRSIDSPQEVPPIIQAAGAGTVVKVDILRSGKKQTLQVTLGRHPADTEQGQAPPPDPKAPDLRERVKKFLEKKEEDRAQGKAPPEEPKAAPKAKPKADPDEDGSDLFSFDDKLMDQLQPLFDQFGIEPDQLFDKGKDGKYRFKGGLQEMLKNFDFKKLFEGNPFGGEEDPIPAPKKALPRPPLPAPKAEPAPRPAGRPWLGLQPEELSDELRAQLDLEDGAGLLVTDVLEGSPAQKAGLRKNDILLKIDGKPVKGEEMLAGYMKSAKVGQESSLTILRKGKEQTFKVTLAERKE